MKILVTGANGFIGKNLLEVLKTKKEYEIIQISSNGYNLLEQDQVKKLFKDYSPDAIFHLAAKVGGILANKTYPADFIYTNLAINTYFLEEAKKANIRRLIYTFCGCSYPKNAPNPIKEEYLFTGLPDENAMFYAMAKATNYLQLLAYRKQYGLDWVAAIPGNAYGPYDNFSDTGSHVIPALIRRFHFAKENDAKEVLVWGSGKPIRDFVYSEDVARALILVLEKYHSDSPINISSGKGVSIKELVYIIKDIVGFDGEVVWDKTKPDGHPIKIFDTTKMRNELGFEPQTDLKDGIKKTYKWFKEKINEAKL
jgi:GDP-L-fucose synthase